MITVTVHVFYHLVFLSLSSNTSLSKLRRVKSYVDKYYTHSFSISSLATYNQIWRHFSLMKFRNKYPQIQEMWRISQQTQGAGPMLVWCWAIVYDAGSTSAQHWAYASCLLGGYKRRWAIIDPKLSNCSCRWVLTVWFQRIHHIGSV